MKWYKAVAVVIILLLIFMIMFYSGMFMHGDPA